MPHDNQPTAPTGSYIPRNADVVAHWLLNLTDTRRYPQDAQGFALQNAAHALDQNTLDAFEAQGLVEGKLEPRGFFRTYRITPHGRAALADFRASKRMGPAEADAFLRDRALARVTREAA